MHVVKQLQIYLCFGESRIPFTIFNVHALLYLFLKSTQISV